MKRRAIRLLTMGVACAMMICGGPCLDLQAMEYPDAGTALTEQGEEESDQEEALFLWQMQQAQRALEALAAEREIIATLYHTDRYPLSAIAGYSESGIVEIPSGGQVMIEGVELWGGAAWYLVTYTQDETSYKGYVHGDFLISADGRFLDWQQGYLSGIPSDVGMALEEPLVGATNDILAFPESYRSYLSQLKSQHPNWVFVPMNTNIQWSTVIAEEMKGDRSWVHSSKPAAWKGEQRDTNWYLATRAAVEYCVDPRNFLNEKYVFMFEQLTYNDNCHTQQGVQNIVQNTFMRGEIPGEGISYSQHFYNLGQSLKVSPFHLASRVYQEQGVNGTSALISGEYPGYEGYYNYYNVKASGTTDKQVIESGLKYAQDQRWNTRCRSIAGGAEFISKNYILKGQDTLYLQKFDVDGSYHGLFSHQYMQNITAPMTEGSTTRKAYESAGALNNMFVFKIPVYENMPISACPEPGISQEGNPTEEQAKQLKAFVIRLYTDALGRSIYREEEVDYWYQRLLSGKSDGAGVAQGFFFSDEFKEKKLSDEAYLDVLYKVMFNRPADAAGRELWLEKLEIGMSREYVYAGFANSTEFAKLCKTYEVKQGVMECKAYRDQNEGVTSFVNRLYQKALGRSGDDQGMEDWCRTILRREQNMESVAYGFIFSSEFLYHNHSDEEFVRIMYRTFLNRECDTAGFRDWVGRLSQGMSREEVFRGFARSVEFRKMMEEYGITPY